MKQTGAKLLIGLLAWQMMAFPARIANAQIGTKQIALPATGTIKYTGSAFSVTNNQGGALVGYSPSGNGVTGATETASMNGVLGTGGGGGTGVQGVSSSGLGVYGLSDYVGVLGENATTGAFGRVGYQDYGVYAVSYGTNADSSAGVYGENLNGGVGVGVTSSGYVGVQGKSDNSIGVEGICNDPAGSGVYGSSNHGSAVQGSTVDGWAGQFNGGVIASGYFTSSDARLKKNIAAIPNGLEKILALHGVTFDWRQSEFPERRFDGKKHVGLIAQEVEKVLPELVHTDNKGYRSVDYVAVVPVLVEAIKQQQKQIDALKAERAGKSAGMTPWWILGAFVFSLGLGRLRFRRDVESP